MVTIIGDTVADYSESRIETEGEYGTEDDAKAAFLFAFTKTECFNIYAEVDCWYFGGSVFGDKPTGRIDYVLTPRPKLISAGWLNGCVGVEVKKSGHKAGPLICQMIDYSKAVFRLPNQCGGSLVCLTSVCAFPGFRNKGAIESVMANHRCGLVTIHRHDLRINVGPVAIFSASGGEIRVRNVGCGYKNGSR